jgi:CRP-like cAMP-binding protein
MPENPHCATCDSKAKNIFCNLNPHLTQLLDQKKISRPYKRKQILFFEGNPAQGIYCLKSGRVKLYKTGPEGKQYILQVAGPPEVLGLESIFSNRHFSATAEVIEDGIICFIDREILFQIVREDPSTAMKITRLLASELKESEEERLDLAQLAVRERLARLLALLGQSHGKKAPNGIRIDLKLSREEMAEMIGTAAETAMRLLKEFKEEKLVEVKGRDITILDQQALAKTGQMP